jgi:protein SCO1/2
MSNTTKLMIIVGITAAVAGFIFSKQYFQKNQQLNFQSLLEYPEKKSFSGFNLQSHDNKNITINDFAGKWTLMFFGYTHCPDVCPTTLTELQKAFKLLKTNQKPEVLFISVDPERDTPDSLNQYTHFFNPDFKSATGDSANILAITSQVGVAFHIGDHKKGDKSYPVDHTAAIFVVNPKKQLYGLFRTPHNAQKIAHDLTLLLENTQ